MELLRNLRLMAGRSRLSGKMTRISRKVHLLNFYHVKSIGIVWDASRPEDFPILSRFHQKMAEQNKDVKIFGYFPGKELPDKYTAIRYFTCSKKDEVNFLYCPVHPDTESFINTEFDILIDLNFRNHFPLVYITSLSRAGLKVGLAGLKPETSPFDLMISMKNPVNIEGYLDQIIYYLEMINSESAKKAV